MHASSTGAINDEKPHPHPFNFAAVKVLTGCEGHFPTSEEEQGHDGFGGEPGPARRQKKSTLLGSGGWAIRLAQAEPGGCPPARPHALAEAMPSITEAGVAFQAEASQEWRLAPRDPAKRSGCLGPTLARPSPTAIIPAGTSFAQERPDEPAAAGILRWARCASRIRAGGPLLHHHHHPHLREPRGGGSAGSTWSVAPSSGSKTTLHASRLLAFCLD